MPQIDLVGMKLKIIIWPLAELGRCVPLITIVNLVFLQLYPMMCHATSDREVPSIVCI